MDTIKIGKFISERRRALGFTQLQLAEKLYISDKAVSKWETGKSMPDVSIMLELSKVLGISVQELLMGEAVTMNDKNNEKVLLDMASEIEQKNRIIWRSMWIIMVFSMIGLLGGLFAAAYFIPEGPWQLVAVLSITLLFLVPCFYALKLEISVGTYKCKICGHEIVPTYKEALNAMHLGTTRYLKCPKCNKRTWCKKIIDK